MIVLHAAFHDGRLVIWAETDASSSAAPPTNERPQRARAQEHPFAAKGAEVVRILAEAIPRATGPRDVGDWMAWLPSTDSGPAPSSPLVVAPPSDKARLRIAPWKVPGVALDVRWGVELLCACGGRATLSPGVAVGKELEYWAEALRFAGSLVARQQFLPGLARTGAKYRARWEPVLTAADPQRAAELARSMPMACRALTHEAFGGAPSTAAMEVLGEFLGSVVDHLVRSATDGALAKPVGTKGKSKPKKLSQFESLHDYWLHALQSVDGRMEGDEAEFDTLLEQIHQWRRPINIAAEAPFRLGFRLEEPESSSAEVDGQGDWQVRYLLQAVDDPSLLVPVVDAWNPRGKQAAMLQRAGFRPREALLSSLGIASKISPKIEESLKTSAPGGFVLDGEEAHGFLTETAWQLEQAGFGVFLPAWWTRKGTKLRLTARAVVKSSKLKSQGYLSLEEVLKFEWQVALGDQKLTLAELKALAKLKSPLVRVRGQWVQLNAEEIQAALAFWKTKGETISARQAVRMALGLANPPGGLPFEGVEAEGWFADLLGQLEGRNGFEMLEVSEGFRGTLRPYQLRGYSWLGFLRRWGFGACLADDMGLGKTVQTLAMIERDWKSTAPAARRPTLLVCPMSVVGNWQREASKFTPDLPVMIHHGQTRTRGTAFRKEAAKHAVVLSSYALLHRDFAILEEVPWAGLILDEAQNVKNPQTKQAQSARALKADYRIALTGTPVENHVGDLWSIMEFLNPGFLGTQAEFKRSFQIPIQANRDPDASRRLQRLTGPFILRRLKTDKSIISDLPDKLEMKVYGILTKEQASLYEAVVSEAAKDLEEAEGIQRKGIVLATLSKLKQVCNHPAQFLGDNSAIAGRSGKLARLTEMLEEALEAGDRALIFTQFAEMGSILRRHLQETFGREVLFLHGGTSKKQRDLMVERFQQSGDDSSIPRLFVLSLKAGGTGLNLTAANHVFHFDRWWNPAVENQATDRAFRIGQKRKVQVHKFLCAGTLEEKIDEMIEQKQEIAGSVVGSGEDWLTKLSTAELKDLFALRSEALDGV